MILRRFRLIAVFALLVVILREIYSKRTIELWSEKKESISKPQILGLKIIYDSWIGVKAALAEDGIQVMAVYPNGPADRSGIQQWDYIVSIHNHKIQSNRDFIFVVGNLAPGTVTTIKYKRKSITYTTEIQIAKREQLSDMISRSAAILSLQAYKDGEKYSFDFKESKIKVLYFFKSLSNLKDDFSTQLIELLHEGNNQRSLIIYGITIQSCRSIKPIGPGPLGPSTEYFCDEIRLKKSDGKPPFDIYYETREQATLHYRVEKKPTVIAIDHEGIIRYANYVDETSIAHAIEAIKALLVEMNAKERK